MKEILSAVNNDTSLNKDNIVEKIRERLPQSSSEYKEWERADFNTNHTFEVEFKTDNNKVTLLHCAVYYKLENILNALLEVEGINVNAVEKNKYDEPFNALLKAQDVNLVKHYKTPLHYAALYNYKEAVDALLKAKGINVNTVDEYETTPLHYAAFNGQKEIVASLLEAKEINVNAKDEYGQTPLHSAARSVHEDAVDILLKAQGIDINAASKCGWTPLHCAVSNCRTKAVETLLKAEEINRLLSKFT
ncbi:ankyrin repeat domain-containing protein [Wolbachia endosymbiont of Cantharis cryptica]|uniref:ankyrin repeat domain-containing protein n=1 Tax=Wolbachia endosymbiont of Cantharis cryptica TaxID=3066132 RepID=UPI00376ECEC9